MPSNYNGQSTGKQLTYIEEFSRIMLNPSGPDPATVMAILFSLEQSDLIALEYIGKAGRGITIDELRPVLGLSNPAASVRLRKLSEREFRGIEIELLYRTKEGSNGAYLHFLNGVTLELIQSVMAKRGFSYEKYWSRRKRRVYTTDAPYVNANTPNKNIQEQEVFETSTSESQQSDILNSCGKETNVDEVFEKDIERAESFIEINPEADSGHAAQVSGCSEEMSEDIVDSLCDPLILRKSVAVLLQELVSFKQECSNLRIENANSKEELVRIKNYLKEELVRIKSHLDEIGQKLKEKIKMNFKLR